MGKSKINERLEEEKLANNGQLMVIVGYKNANHIDVKFEDGTIVKDKMYSCFQKGSISNPTTALKNNKIGQTKIANNGQRMTIISYRNKNNLDIQFEDGTIVKHKTFTSFRKGETNNPNFYKSRIGEINKNKQGLNMRIVEYNGCKDINVEFEDKTLVKHKTYINFKSGKITNPNFKKVQKLNLFKSRKGEVNIINNGQKITIIRYENDFDIDVQFEDGIIVKNKSYKDFINSRIHYPHTNLRVLRIGEERVSQYGEIAKIIEYRNAEDIDIEFEDGTKKEHLSYFKFKKGKFHSKKKSYSISFIETIYYFYLHKIGFDKKPIGYLSKFNKNFNKKDLDAFNEELMIGFEYDGAYYHKDKRDLDLYKDRLCSEAGIFLIRLRESGLALLNSKMSYEISLKKSYQNNKQIIETLSTIIAIINSKYNKKFCLDIDIDRDYNEIVTLYKSLRLELPNKRLGETNISTQGQIMTIIEYINNKNISVEFDDGVIVKNKSYQEFKEGQIKNPILDINLRDKTGETKIATNGMKMTIIRFKSCVDMDIQFEDGTIITGHTYSNFKEGTIKNPNLDNIRKIDRIGESNTAKNGLKMTIIYNNGNENLDIEFEDGVIVKNKRYYDFKNGNIGHPYIRYNQKTKRYEKIN